MKNYTATIGGVTKSLLDWGFNTAQMQTANQAPDTVTLTSTLSQLALDDVFPLDEIVDIHRGDTRIFSGRCVPAIGATHAKRTGTIRLDGAWAELESRQCLQLWHVAGEGGGSNEEFGRLSLNVDPALFDAATPAAWLIKTGEAVQKVLELAISKGAPLQIGTIDDGPQAPSESVQDCMDSDVIVRLLRWTPGAVVYFDYATDPVTVHVRQPAAIEAVTLPVTAFEQIPKIQRSWRQIVKAVYLKYHLQAFVETAFNSSFSPAAQYPPAGPGVPLIGERGAILFSLDATDASDMSNASLARAVYESYQAMLWNVDGSLHADDVPTAIRVGQALNISGSRPAWAAMNTLVQRTTDDFKNGTRRIECGAPRTLTGRDLLTLLMPNRRRTAMDFNKADQQASGQSGSESYGSDGKGNGTSSGDTIPGASPHTYYAMKDVGGTPTPIFATVNSKEIG